MMSLRVSGLVSMVLASSSTLLLTVFATHCNSFGVPIWSALVPMKDRNLENRRVG